ncbi:hypothetical protein [Falsarthrobacter nasiphocae]|uniref:Multidrug efflux pump subunit AcrA (Membrane-fusion protein) n=1 Tax=Falsarthrobacter nasiphocae TaxID=189863 RepID=A0AAE3YHV2_9MICC|nr:hypothetical protein [Falsarthrobacter nasiphocae]MDR6892036.1 hypothetical protein [Falsarthrobacter nasiphocae]
MKKAVKVLIGVILVAALTVGTWFTAQSVQSPEQRRAQAEAPQRSRLTAPVEKGLLEDSVNLTCTAGYLRQLPVELKGEEKIVTRVFVKQGTTVRSGKGLAEVQGQPVVALAGSFPFYRDITPKTAGPDVDQLRSALAGLGYLAVTGYERGTAAGKPVMEALALLLRDLGYPTIDVADGAPAGLFVVVPEEGGTVLTAQAEPGPAQKPLLSLGIGEKRWLCVGGDGQLPHGVEAGQKATLSTSPGKKVTVGVERKVTGDDAAAAGAPGAPGGHGAEGGPAGTKPGAQGAGQESSDKGALVAVVSRDAKEKETRANLNVVVNAGPKDSLIVPASALWTKDGKTLVRVVQGDPSDQNAAVRDVEVTPGLALGGRTVITPAAGQKLAAGDAVLVEDAERRGEGGAGR